MAIGNVQGVEIVIVGLDLAVVFDRVAHRNENVLDLLPQDRDRVQMTGPRTPARNGNIEAFALDLQFIDSFGQASFTGFQCRNDVALKGLDGLSECGPVRFVDLSYRLFQLDQPRSLSGKPYSNIQKVTELRFGVGE